MPKTSDSLIAGQSKRQRITSRIEYSDGLEANDRIEHVTDVSLQGQSMLEAEYVPCRPIGYLGDIVLYDTDISAILSHKWINDNVINAWMHLLNASTYDCIFFSTFAVDCNAEIPKINRKIFQAQIKDFIQRTASFVHCRGLIIPLNISNCHWTLLFVDLREHYTMYIDSMQIKDTARAFRVGDAVIRELYLCCPGLRFPRQWRIKLSVSHFRQSDQINCGIFVRRYAQSLAMGDALNESEVAEMSVSHNAKKFAEYLAQKQHNVSQLLDFLLHHDTPYVQVEWSSGDITREPLSVIYETCSDLVHDLLHELQDRSDRTNLVKIIREKLFQRRGDRRDKRKVHFKRGKPDVHLIPPDSDDDDDFSKAPSTSKRQRKD